MSKSELLSKNSSPEAFFFSCSLCETSWDCLRCLTDTQTADSTWVFFFFLFSILSFSHKMDISFYRKAFFFWPCVCVYEVSAARVPSQFPDSGPKNLGPKLKHFYISTEKRKSKGFSLRSLFVCYFENSQLRLFILAASLCKRTLCWTSFHGSLFMMSW